ncbi:hypothetical protein LRD69_02335 [Streptomyces sp. JH14]|nr:hypothetical protein [Streptomyces sp. JH14]MDF6041015.1 hypothetical protein [Streptomyces sp. JH14]
MCFFHPFEDGNARSHS